MAEIRRTGKAPKGLFKYLMSGREEYDKARTSFEHARMLAKTALTALADGEADLLNANPSHSDQSEGDRFRFEGLRYAKHNLSMVMTVLDVVLKERGGDEQDEIQ